MSDSKNNNYEYGGLGDAREGGQRVPGYPKNSKKNLLHKPSLNSEEVLRTHSLAHILLKI